MPLPSLAIQERLRAAVSTVCPEADLETVQVRPCPDPRFGDYQAVALMSLAKSRQVPPRQLAAEVLARLDLSDLCEAVEVAGPGFVNFRLRPQTVAAALSEAAEQSLPFVTPAAAPRTVVVDFSSPNVAKPMHVGHIRSTILGDCLARVLRRLGHRVITDNHLGDWGTQFGMLLLGWKRFLDLQALTRDAIAEMERLYKLVHAACQQDPSMLEAARRELVALQGGDPQNLAIWREMTTLSRAEFDRIYERLGIRFDYTLGESFYHPRLQALVDELVRLGLARESEGAKVIFFDNLPDLKDTPLIIQKSDGAFNYATTDLATLLYRIETWHPDEILYVTDARQQLHFRQVFAAFRMWRPDAAHVKLVHVWFGTILGEDGKPFKTRSGDTVKLSDLLDEAEERALQVVTVKQPELPEAERRRIARVVGLGAVKYADLLSNRQSDYVFSWDRMLSLSGNTAPYLQYAYARTASIFRKGGLTAEAARASAAKGIGLQTPEELALGRHLLDFGLVLEAVAEDYRPNYLCNYLFELAGRFTRFYETCPVLKAPEPERSHRLYLCEVTARVLRLGLEALGVEVLDQM
ncbi:MAG: arginine--tRNA ligase [Verrucomicrobiota bacterium]|nr:arginine--tRNA ligase [Limisphaera sp.]MDW8381902.1 arginine--tRNA ligase [Verrucomicrobiota bacterium]